MTASSLESRRGIALLLALGIVLMLLAGLTVWMATAARAGTATSAWTADTGLWAQEQGGEALALAWLAAREGALVAPPEGGSWTIVADRWATPAAEGWLTVTVHDGWAGIPPHLAGPRGVLRRSLPWFLAGSDFTSPVAVTERPSTASELLEVLEVPVGARRLPPPHPAPPASADAWRSAAVTGAQATPSVDMGAQLDAPCAAFVLSPHSDGSINLNTAPIELVEQVLRLQGGLMLADLRRNRLSGVPSVPPPDLDRGDGHPRLVAGSGVWNLHITAGWNGRVRSWWVVVAGSSANARIVQRHVCVP